MKMTIAQMNPVIGDLKGNYEKVLSYVDYAKRTNVNFIVLPELTLTGYPPKDLLLHNEFIRQIEEYNIKLMNIKDIAILIGTIRIEDDKLYNSALLVDNGNVTWQDKFSLPTYDVFDETRYFTTAKKCKPLIFQNLRLGVHICEDGWSDKTFFGYQRYEIDPVEMLANQKCDLFINLSASPYHIDKGILRRKIMANLAKKYSTPYLYVNQVGGNDELIFDGRSFLLNDNGEIVLEGVPFKQDIINFNFEMINKIPEVQPAHEGIQAMVEALILGVRDYMEKTGFKKAVIGLSGGIDSSVVAALAVKAVGKENVLGVAIPSRYSSKHSITDAEKLASNLGIEIRKYFIEDVHAAYEKVLNTTTIDETQYLTGVSSENIQARIRGSLLMAISNRESRLLLSTGNKSEMAVGYATLYGDMAGGLAVISDVPKTVVYKLVEFLNRKEEIIPKSIIVKPPSAELRPDQVDSDSLPAYDILDEILEALIEEQKSLDEIVMLGFEKETVQKVLKMVKNNEYKRSQAPIGLKVTTKAFGSGRRYPIAQAWNFS